MKTLFRSLAALLLASSAMASGIYNPGSSTGGGGSGSVGGTITASPQFSLGYYSHAGTTDTIKGFPQDQIIVSTNTGVTVSTFTATSSATVNGGFAVHGRLDVGDAVASGPSAYFYVGGADRVGITQPGLGTNAGFDFRDTSGTGMRDAQMTANSFTFTSGFGLIPLGFINSTGLIVGATSGPTDRLDIKGSLNDNTKVGVIGHASNDGASSRGFFRLGAIGSLLPFPALEFGLGATQDRDATIYRIPNPVGLGFAVGTSTVAMISASSMTITGPNGLYVTYGTNLGSTTVNDLTASLPVQTDSNKKLISSQISLSTSVFGTLPVANGGTGTTTPGLVAGTNITSITGTWPNQTINAATQSGGGGGTVIAVTTGSLTGFSVTIATPTSAINLDQAMFQAQLTGSATAFVTIAYSTTTQTTNYTATSTSPYVSANCGSACTITLSTTSLNGSTLPRGFVFMIAQAGAGNVTVSPAAGTISGGSTALMNQQYSELDVIWDGNNYMVK